MTLEQFAWAGGTILAAVGWIEVRTKNLISQSERVQDERHKALASIVDIFKDSVNELTANVRELSRTVSEFKGRIYAQEGK
jgi:hypothetical protein